MQSYFSNGKLLITAEYAVMDGAKALALPTRYGQSLKITPIADSKLEWTSFDADESIWYKNTFLLKDSEIVSTSDCQISKTLLHILNVAQQLNPLFLKDSSGFKITTHLQFPRQWGLGTSSTLINNIAEWANIDAYRLLAQTFGGSGYDIACARHNTPITYLLDKTPLATPISFNPPFKEHLYFIYLNKKQNSRTAISDYRSRAKIDIDTRYRLDTITDEIINCTSLSKFMQLIETHESIIGALIGQTPIKLHLFNDFEGSIKSLGAWGGDFVLAACHSNPLNYFKNKGYNTVLTYDEMILQ